MYIGTAKGVRREIRPKVEIDVPCPNSWRCFLEAAHVAAARLSMHTEKPVPAFDLRVVGGESLVCLVLEIWISELYRKHCKSLPRMAPGLFGRFSRRSWSPSPTRGLIGMLAEPGGRGALNNIYKDGLARG